MGALIGIEGFEKYGPAGATTFEAYNAANLMNFNATLTFMPSQSMQSEWVPVSEFTNGLGIITGLNGRGKALGCSAGNNPLQMFRTLPTNYARMIFGFAFKETMQAGNTGGYGGLCFYDGVTAQCGISINVLGQIVIWRGEVSFGTVIYASAPLVIPNTRNYLEVDITVHNSAGAFTIWLNGNQITTMSSQNTRGGTSNNYMNTFSPRVGSSMKFAWDDMYWRDNTDGLATPYGDCGIAGLTPTGDSSVQFSPALSTLGPWYVNQVVATNNGGANQLLLVPVTPTTNMTINSVQAFPDTTSGSINNKGVIYADSAGSPGALLSSGTQVTGMTTNIVLNLPLVTPQALTGGTQYWIGLISDTNWLQWLSDQWTTKGQFKSNTYASGAPNPAGTMGGSFNTPMFWGSCTGAPNNYENLIGSPPPNIVGTNLAYNQSSTVGQEDLFTYSSLPVTPTTVFAIKISTFAAKSDSGARTFTNQIKSSTTDQAGATQTLNGNYVWYSDLYLTDPHTGIAWTGSGVNALTAGYKLTS